MVPSSRRRRSQTEHPFEGSPYREHIVLSVLNPARWVWFILRICPGLWNTFLLGFCIFTLSRAWRQDSSVLCWLFQKASARSSCCGLPLLAFGIPLSSHTHTKKKKKRFMSQLQTQACLALVEDFCGLLISASDNQKVSPNCSYLSQVACSSGPKVSQLRGRAFPMPGELLGILLNDRQL